MCVPHLERCSSLVAATRGVLLLKQMVEKKDKKRTDGEYVASFLSIIVTKQDVLSLAGWL